MLCLTSGDHKVCYDENQVKELADALVHSRHVYDLVETEDSYVYEGTLQLPVKLVFAKSDVKPLKALWGRIKPSAIVMHDMRFYCWKEIADNVDRVFDLTVSSGNGRVKCVAPGYGDMSYGNYGNGSLFVDISDIIFED